MIKRFLPTILLAICWVSAWGGETKPSLVNSKNVLHFPVEERSENYREPGVISMHIGFGLAFPATPPEFSGGATGILGHVGVGVKVGRRATILPNTAVYYFPDYATVVAPEAAFRYSSDEIGQKLAIFAQAGIGALVEMTSGTKSYLEWSVGLGARVAIARNLDLFAMMRYCDFFRNYEGWQFAPVTVGFVF